MLRKIGAVIVAAALSFILSFSMAAESVPSEVLEAVLSVVRIGVWYGGDEYATGSGFVVRSDNGVTYIVTNYHVVEGKPKEICVIKKEPIPLSVVAFTKEKDLAILKAEQNVTYKPLKLKETGSSLGDAIFAAGFPGDADLLSDTMAYSSLEVTLTDGIISSIKHMSPTSYGDPITVLQINADINHGNSGGPLLNKKGQVVGINTYGVSSGINGAIDVRELIEFMDSQGISYKTGGEVSALWIIPTFLCFGGLIILVVVKSYKKKNQKKIETQSTYPKQKGKTYQKSSYSTSGNVRNSGSNASYRTSSTAGRSSRVKGH